MIKDEVDENINIINANRVNNKTLYNVDIIQFDKDFNFISNLIANEVFIENKNWLIKDAQLTNFYGKNVNIKDYNF